MNSKEIMKIAVKAADEKRANDISVLDMQEVSLLADYFVIADADSQRQVNAIVENIIDQEEEASVKIGHIEGRKDSSWILVDMGDVVVHIFTKEMRDFYKIEDLWSDAKIIDVSNYIEA